MHFFGKRFMSICGSSIFDDFPERLPSSVNPYVGRLIQLSEEGKPLYYGRYLKAKKGNWKKGSEAVYLEIGSHKGDTLVAMAADHPDSSFIGMDITFKRVVTAYERAQAASLSNISLIYGDAREVGQIFDPGELNGVIVFFPDPWIKKARQSHHRLFTEEFAAYLGRLIAPGGFLWVKTDVEAYLSTLGSSLSPLHFHPWQESLPPMVEKGYGSRFESNFQSIGRPTFEGLWKRVIPCHA